MKRARQYLAKRQALVVLGVVVVHAAALVGLLQQSAVRAPQVLPERLIEVVLSTPVEPTVHAQPATPSTTPTLAPHAVNPPPIAAQASLAPHSPAPESAASASPNSTASPASSVTTTSAAASTAVVQHTAGDAAPSPVISQAADTQPATDANYLCAAPAYPDKSARLHESGRVVISLVVEADGSVSQAAVKTSSGFARLDEAARSAVSRCRFRPGTRNGVPQAMPYEWLWTFGSKDH